MIGLPMLLRGGTEIQTLTLAGVLKEEGYRVTVCCYYEFDAEMVEEFIKAGAEVTLLKMRRPRNGRSYAGMVRLLWRLILFFKRTDPSVAHIQYVAPGLIPILAARVAGVKRIFATIHYPRHSFGLREQRLVRIGAGLCRKFFCNSLGTEKSWFGSAEVFEGASRAQETRHCTVYNCVDAEGIESLVKKLDRKIARASLGITQKQVVGFVGRLRSEKGVPFLLRSFKRVLYSLPDTLLLVVGDGPDRGLLEAYAKEMGVAGSVRWSGGMNHAEACRLFGVMDVAVVPSEFEGFGLSAAEAMAAALPVVASDVDGLREVIDDGISGLLVPFGESEQMAGALCSILANPSHAQEMGRSGNLRVRQFFSRSRFRTATVDAYARS